jgi:WD40 repeat protein
VPRDLETIALKCLHKEPVRRYESARGLADDLARYLAGEPILARPVGTAERLVRWCRRNPWLAGANIATAAATVLLAIGATLAAWTFRGQRDQIKRQSERTSEALDEAKRERTSARERLWESLIAQGRAERLAGSRWAAIGALADAASMKTTDDLRHAAIQAIVAPGVRLDREIPFGQAYVVRFSSDGALLAVAGIHHGDPRDRGGGHAGIIVYRLADGHEVDRIELDNVFGAANKLEFRPGSPALAFEELRDGRWGLRVRNTAQHEDVGFVTGSGGPDFPTFSPDGTRLLVESDGLRVMNADNLRLEQSRSKASAVAFLSDDELMVEEGRFLKGWDLRTGAETFAFAMPQGMSHLVHSDGITSGSLVIVIDTATFKNAALWDARTGKEVTRLDDVVPERDDLRRTAAGSLLAFDVRSRPGEILLYDVARQSPRGRIDGVISAGGNFNREQRSALSPNSRMLAAYSRRNDNSVSPTIQVWNCETGQKIAALRDCKIPIWSPDGRHLATIAPGTIPDAGGFAGSPEALVKIWEVADPTPAYRQNRPIASISSSTDGRRLAVDDQLWEFDSDPGPPGLKPLPLPVKVELVAFTGSGALYAAPLRNPDLFKRFEQATPIWQLEPIRRDLALPSFENLDGVAYSNDRRLTAFSPDGRFGAVLWHRWAKGKGQNWAAHVGEQLDLWDLTTPRRIQVVFKTWSKVRFQPNGGYSFVEPRNWIIPFGQNPRQLAFGADSRKLAIAYNTGVVIYDVPDGKPLRWLSNADHPQPGHTRGISAHCVAFSPDGQWVCYGGEEGRFNIGSVEPSSDEPPVIFIRPAGDTSPRVAEREPKVAWKGHEGTILAVSVSPDGCTVASGGEDRMICLWQVPSGRALARWEAHDVNVTALAFTRDGRTLVSGAADGMLKLWDLPMIRRELAALGLDW